MLKTGLENFPDKDSFVNKASLFNPCKHMSMTVDLIGRANTVFLHRRFVHGKGMFCIMLRGFCLIGSWKIRR